MRLTAYVLCHKLEHLLDRAVASILTQTRKPDRIVLVGTDCRTETYDTFSRWTAHAPGMETAFSDTPLTCAQSKNFAARCHKNATSPRPIVEDDAFFILDADDWLMPRFVDLCLGYMEATKADAVGCDYQIVRSTGRVNNSDTNTPCKFDLTKGNPLPCCSIVRQSSFERIGGYREDLIFEDWALWIAMHRAGMKLFRYPQILFNHCRHATNLTNHTNVEEGCYEIRCLLSSTTASPSPRP